jgi:hypothetical protein
VPIVTTSKMFRFAFKTINKKKQKEASKKIDEACYYNYSIYARVLDSHDAAVS